MYSFVFCVLFAVIYSTQAFTIREDRGCPKTDGIFGICLFDPKMNCLRQEQCPSGYSCCPFGCGNQCLATTTHNFQHPGTCPTNPTPMSTTATCKHDQECKYNEKCCGSGFCIAVRDFAVPVLFVRH